MFASFDLRDSPPSNYYDPTTGLVPQDGALVQVDGGAIDIDQFNQNHPTTFPLALSEGSGDTDLHRTFNANGMQFEILAWLGDDVSNSTRAEVDDLVASIRFPSPPDPSNGEGIEFEPGLVSLGSADRYPAGSVTPITVASGGELAGSNFVVVHAPEGFYVLAGSTDCALIWHSDDRRLVGCPARPGPWNKYGRRIGGKIFGPGALRPVEVGVNFDGGLIATPFDAPIDTRDYWNKGPMHQQSN
jgi:hypothetical protein